MRRLFLSALMLAAAVSAVASAKAESDSIISLKEISVTAIKEQSSISRAPMAVTKINIEEIRNQEINSVKEASALVPNLYMPDYGSRMTSSIYIRGIGARMDQPAVGLNIDNVPYLNKDSYDFDMPDIERIEVFRGPQTSLYGRNTMGGLISVYTLSPYNFQGLKASVLYGSGNTWKASAGYYTKFSDKLAASLTFNYLNSDGFFRNTFTGKKIDTQNNFGVRLRVDHHPRTNLTISNVLSVNRVDQGGYPYKYEETGEIAFNDVCSYDRLSITDGLTFTWNLNGVNISSISSFQYLNDDMKLDQDFRPVDYFTLNQKRHEPIATQDIIIRGGKGKYTWLGGVFGFYKHSSFSAPVVFKNDGIADLIEGNINKPGMPVKILWDEREMTLNSNFKTPVMGAAVYHRSTLRLGGWNLSADLRLDYEHNKLEYDNFVNTMVSVYRVMGPVTVPISEHTPIEKVVEGKLSHSFLELMPKFTAEYNFTDVSVYASVSKGYKSGGYNTQMFSDILQQELMAQMGTKPTYNVDEIISFRPERSWNYEVGTHFAIPSANLKGSAAVFYIDCKNQQLTKYPDGSTTGRITSNAGESRSAGFELSLSYTPVKNLDFNASYGYTNAKFEKYVDGTRNYKGNYVPYAPANTIFVSGNYLLELTRNWKLNVNASMNGVGKIYWNEDNSESQPLYTLFNLAATISYDDCALTIRGENIFDKKYDVFYFESVRKRFLQQGLPARISATLSYNF